MTVMSLNCLFWYTKSLTTKASQAVNRRSVLYLLFLEDKLRVDDRTPWLKALNSLSCSISTSSALLQDKTLGDKCFATSRSRSGPLTAYLGRQHVIPAADGYHCRRCSKNLVPMRSTASVRCLNTGRVLQVPLPADKL